MTDSEPECNGICLFGWDLGIPDYGSVLAYAHPDCQLHGDPEPEHAEEDICAPGEDELLRYVREEDCTR